MTLAQPTPVEDDIVPFFIRDMRPDELTFVASTWVRSYLSSTEAKKIESDEYFHGHSHLVSSILARGVALVAEHKLYGNLLGHVVGERHALGPVVHYAYTKGDYRKRGIGRALEAALLLRVRREPGELVRFTHSRAPGNEIARRRGYRWSPYALYPQEKKR
jgi:GNAT superfamily N-acetyltransferase